LTKKKNLIIGAPCCQTSLGTTRAFKVVHPKKEEEEEEEEDSH